MLHELTQWGQGFIAGMVAGAVGAAALFATFILVIRAVIEEERVQLTKAAFDREFERRQRE